MFYKKELLAYFISLLLLSLCTSELKSSAAPQKKWSSVIKGKNDDITPQQKVTTDHQIQAPKDDEMQRLANVVCLSTPLKKSHYACLNQTYHKIPACKGKLKFR